MKWLFTAIAFLLLAVIAAVIARDDPGYLVINYQDWVIETSAVLAVVVLLLFFAALYLLLRLYINTRRMPKFVRRWRRHRRAERANAALTNGLLELSRGDWRKAERLLLRHVDNSETPLLNYLTAARAAQKQGDDQRRDHYLQQAYKVMPKAEVAIGLTQAELQLKQGQMEQALATLTHLRQQAPRNMTVLKLLLRLYVQLHDWERLLELVPVTLKHKVIDRDEARRLEIKAHTALLQQASDDQQHLHDAWQRIGKTMRHNNTVLQAYVRGLIRHRQGGEAEALVNQALERDWDPELARLYGQLDGADVGRQIRYAEEWLTHRRHDPVLLLTLGRLCLRNRLWAQARQYLETSMSLEPSMETCTELAHLFEQQGENDKALRYYRQGAQLIGYGTSLPALDAK
jgi:HemY protein